MGRLQKFQIRAIISQIQLRIGRHRDHREEVNQAMCRRNMEMALTTDRLIRDNKKPFSIAGALHFAGPMGMHKLLTNMGYKVTQIICEEPK